MKNTKINVNTKRLAKFLLVVILTTSTISCKEDTKLDKLEDQLEQRSDDIEKASENIGDVEDALEDLKEALQEVKNPQDREAIRKRVEEIFNEIKLEMNQQE